MEEVTRGETLEGYSVLSMSKEHNQKEAIVSWCH